MNTEARLKELQEWMSRIRSNPTVTSPPELGKWIDELTLARDDAASTATSLRNIADVNETLNLLTGLFEEAHTRHISAEQVRSLLDMLHARLSSTLEEIRPLYL